MLFVVIIVMVPFHYFCYYFYWFLFTPSPFRHSLWVGFRPSLHSHHSQWEGENSSFQPEITQRTAWDLGFSFWLSSTLSLTLNHFSPQSAGALLLPINDPIGSFVLKFLHWTCFVCFFLAQETGCLHLRCSSAELHGRQRRRLQAGDHWQREGLCFHWLWHCHPEGFWMEAPGGPCYPAALRRWWVKERDSAYLASSNGQSETSTLLPSPSL